MSVLKAVERRVFGAVVMDKVDVKAAWLGDDSEEVMAQTIRTRRFEPKLIIMSRDTQHEIMREDFNNSTGILTVPDKLAPRRVFGIRVAYDDSLAIGEVLLVERYV